MPEHIRYLVSWKPAAAPPRDAFTNTLYYQYEGLLDPDYDGDCEAIGEVYNDASFTAGCRVEVKAYDMSDPEPREVKGFFGFNKSGSRPDGDPEVALCLSYYGDRNLPTSRGRIYCGPWSAATLTTRPSDIPQNTVMALGAGLAGIGGEDVSWRQRSVKTGDYNHIRTIWTNDEWDVIRSRGLRETVRKTQSV